MVNNLSIQEKGIWTSLLTLAGTSAYVFSHIFAAYASGTPMPASQLAALVFALILVGVAIEVAFHVTVSLCGKDEPKDERDQLIDAKAARNAYYLLISGLVIMGGHAAAAEVLAYGRMPGAQAMVVAVLFALVVAEIGHFISQLVYYRRGV